ncbi:MAG TPA: phage tail tape measure protein [Allosphingosinicella sp.]|jgi:lambda family phage tail tape measure protein
MAETLATARINLTLDASDMMVALERAKEAQKGLGANAQAEAAKMTAAQRRVVESLDRQIDKLGLTREQMVIYNIATRTTGETQAALLSKVQSTTAALNNQAGGIKNATREINQYGLSAKQQTAAMRQVPAQITDIFVSLAGGQNPMMVLIQQGGQLKDVFGGIVPAARALGGALLALVNPYTVAAAAIAAVGAVAISESQRMEAFGKAMLTTGITSRMTKEELAALSAEIDKLDGVTRGRADESILALAANTKLSGEEFKRASALVAEWSSLTGDKAEEVAKRFADLGKEPYQALLKLAEGGANVTTEMLDAAYALEESGQRADAAKIAFNAMADDMERRNGAIRANLSGWSAFWRDIKDEAAGAWAAIAGAMSAQQGQASRGPISNIIGRGMGAYNPIFKDTQGSNNAVEAAMAAASARTASARAAGEARRRAAAATANDALKGFEKSAETPKDRLDKEITAIKNWGKALVEAGGDAAATTVRVNALIAAKQKAFDDKQPKGRSGAGAARALSNADASRELDGIKNEEQTARNAIQNSTALLQAQYGARLVSAKDYYAQQRSLLQQDTRAQVESLEKQLAYLKSRDVAGKDSINVSKQIADVEAKLSQVRADGANKLEILTITEDSAAKQRARALSSYKEALAAENDALQQSSDATVRRIILGEEAASQQERIAAIMQRGAERQRDLARELAEDNDSAKYDEKIAELRRWMDEQIRITEDGYARMKAAQADWLNGVRSGVADWMTRTSDVASQVSAITNKSLDGAAEAFTQFAITGKANIKGLLIDIGTEITRFLAKQAILKFLAMFGQYMVGAPAAGGVTTIDTGASRANWAAKGAAFDGANAQFFAKGGAFTNGIYNSPTMFKFANGGKFGVMGEAGPEAVMPLAKDSGGRLGVRMAGGGGGGPPQVGVVVNIHSDGSSNSQATGSGIDPNMARQMGDSMRAVVSEEVDKYMRPGGKLWAARGGRQ